MQESAIVLENETHRAKLYPQRGGKTGSFVEKASGFELLAQPKNGQYSRLYSGMPFSEGDASGFDDVFPSMGVETVTWGSEKRVIPDHGEIWTSPMQARVQGNTAELWCEGRNFPYVYQKTVILEGETLRYSFQIANRGDRALPCMWVCHCLMRWEDGVHFSFPDGAEELLELGPSAQRVVDRRTSARNYCLPPEPGRAMKFYFTRPVREGRCAARYPRSAMIAEMCFEFAGAAISGVLDYDGRITVAIKTLRLSRRPVSLTPLLALAKKTHCGNWRPGRSYALNWRYGFRKDSGAMDACTAMMNGKGRITHEEEEQEKQRIRGEL